MEIAARSWLTTGVAFVGAGAVAFAPITPSSPAPELSVTPVAVSAPVELAAVDWPYILSLPIVRQSVINWAENWAVYLSGFAESGIGLAESLIAIPGVTVEIIQELATLDFVGAFDTFAAAVRDSVVAVGQPLLDSWIWRYQKALLVDVALAEAWPQAIIDVANGFLAAGGGVTTALIQGTQDFVAAVLTLNLTNIVDAAVDGTRNFVVSLGEGATSIIDGIESAQLGISTALATEPPPPPTFADVESPAVDSTMDLAAPAVAFSVDTDVVTEDETPVTDPEPENDPAATPEPTESDTEAVELEQDAPAEESDDVATEDEVNTEDKAATEGEDAADDTDSETGSEPGDSAAGEETAEAPSAEPASDSE